ncbi:WGR domain-containing protein [Nannocystis pusilla]|uniref:WGR domain-containing protein n=1 Tax=Nannocystis pusilla TaxID=889268 RepID=A0ABS7TK45_9BACT|nr:WGR domain-containing protein [Nannocystis pusilla]MBZ5708584.1 WGR domain-containing protein [Nannocystis pusilla]
MQDAIAPALRLHDRLVAPRNFWSYVIDGEAVTMTQGRVGTDGKSTSKSLESEDAARAFARKSLEQRVAKGFVDASLRYEIAAWEDVASALRGPGNGEEPTDRVLVLPGPTRLPHSLWIEFREGILSCEDDDGRPFAGILVRGDLDIDGALYGYEDDFGPFLQVEGNLRARAIATGGARIDVAGDIVTEELVGAYNHGLVRARGRLSARVIASEHTVQADGGLDGLRYLGWGGHVLSVQGGVADESDPYDPAGVFVSSVRRNESVDLQQARRSVAAGGSILVASPTSIRQEFARKMAPKLASREKVKTLSLAGKGLTLLPDELFAFRNLVKLDLTHCRLRALPDRLGELTGLRELVLRGNGLQRLPDSIGELAELRSLELEANCLVDLPPSLERCTKLQRLVLTNNPYSYVRRSFGGWHRVALMWQLPDVVFRLPALEHLEFDQTFVRSLPEGRPASESLRVKGVRGTLLPEREAQRFPGWNIDAASSVGHALFYARIWLHRENIPLERFWDPTSGRYDFSETDALLRLILRIQIPTAAPYDDVLAVLEKQSAALAGELNWSGKFEEQVRRLFQSFVAVLDVEAQELPGHPLITRLRPIFERHAAG